MITSRWKIWVDCTTEAKARKVVSQVHEAAFAVAPTFSIRPYEKGGFVAEWTHEHLSEWSDAVVEVIATGQRLGTGWTILGDVHADPEGLLSTPKGHISVSGVTMIIWSLAPSQNA